METYESKQTQIPAQTIHVFAQGKKLEKGILNIQSKQP